MRSQMKVTFSLAMPLLQVNSVYLWPVLGTYQATELTYNYMKCSSTILFVIFWRHPEQDNVPTIKLKSLTCLSVLLIQQKCTEQ